jgi:hypothetical protein
MASELALAAPSTGATDADADSMRLQGYWWLDDPGDIEENATQ